LAANLVGQMIGNRELQKMSGNSFVAQDRSRIFNRGANIEVLRLRIVSWDKIKAARVLIVNAGRIHKPAGTGRLERVRQLANLEWSQIIRQGNEMPLTQKPKHFLLAAFVRLEKCWLIGRDRCGAGRIG